jgi:hypothetical protein
MAWIEVWFCCEFPAIMAGFLDANGNGGVAWYPEGLGALDAMCVEHVVLIIIVDVTSEYFMVPGVVIGIPFST